METYLNNERVNIMINSDIEQIEKENWRKAIGIKGRSVDTNSALAMRDYSLKCKHKYKVGVINGYWLWWCSTHHQPFLKCENARLKIKLDAIQKSFLLGEPK